MATSRNSKKIYFGNKKIQIVSFNLYGWMNVSTVLYENFEKTELNARY